MGETSAVRSCFAGAMVTDSRAATGLSMHDELPFDEVTQPPHVSTGDLPGLDDVRRIVTEAYELYRTDGSGAVADYIPVLGHASPDLFGIAVVGCRGRSFGIGDV